jgi:signal transduction histidine kinase
MLAVGPWAHNRDRGQMMRLYGRTRSWVAEFASRHRIISAALMFLFLFNVSNYVEWASRWKLRIPDFSQMMITGVVMATFGALLLAEVLRLHRQAAEARMVRVVVRTLGHEINNPLQVVQLTAEQLRGGGGASQRSAESILAEVKRIRHAVSQLGSLEGEVRLRQAPGFPGLIDLDRSS